MTADSPGQQLFQRSHASLLQRFMELERQNLPSDTIAIELTDMADDIVREYNTSSLIAGQLKLSDEDEKEFRSNVRGLQGGGALVPLLERADVENIHILGHDKVVLSLADGRRIPGPPMAASEAELVMMIRHLAATAGHTSRRFDTAAPILDLRLASGHRLFAVTAVAERTSVVIRRHRMLQSSLENLEESGTVTPEMTEVLRAAVRPPDPTNMLIVGGTGAGKTTLLRSLLSEVPQSEFVVTIEDTLELHLRSSGLHERTLALETRTANSEGLGEITMYDCCKAALRMSPDRVIVGEVRGGEVMQLLQSMGIGNDGSLGTIHAGSTKAAINKMLIYAQRSPDSPTPDSVLREIAQVLHLMVYIKKLPDGRRAVTSIMEVTGYEDGRVLTSEVFAPGPDGIGVYTRPFMPDGEALARLMAAGFDPAVLGEPCGPDALNGEGRDASPAASKPRKAMPPESDPQTNQPPPHPTPSTGGNGPRPQHGSPNGPQALQPDGQHSANEPQPQSNRPQPQQPSQQPGAPHQANGPHPDYPTQPAGRDQPAATQPQYRPQPANAPLPGHPTQPAGRDQPAITTQPQPAYATQPPARPPDPTPRDAPSRHYSPARHPAQPAYAPQPHIDRPPPQYASSPQYRPQPAAGGHHPANTPANQPQHTPNQPQPTPQPPTGRGASQPQPGYPHQHQPGRTPPPQPGPHQHLGSQHQPQPGHPAQPAYAPQPHIDRPPPQYASSPQDRPQPAAGGHHPANTPANQPQHTPNQPQHTPNQPQPTPNQPQHTPQPPTGRGASQPQPGYPHQHQPGRTPPPQPGPHQHLGSQHQPQPGYQPQPTPPHQQHQPGRTPPPQPGYPHQHTDPLHYTPSLERQPRTPPMGPQAARGPGHPAPTPRTSDRAPYPPEAMWPPTSTPTSALPPPPMPPSTPPTRNSPQSQRRRALIPPPGRSGPTA